MNKNTIVKKLKEFLQKHKAFTEECEVIYLMVEIRKILDYGENSYKTLRFYCNWVLHNKLSKEKTTKLLLDIFEPNIDLKKDGHENARDIKSVGADFFKLNTFKNELEKFLKNHGLSMNLLNKNWRTFEKLLLEIIKDCPVVFMPSKIQRLNVIKCANGDYSYKFSLINSRCKPVVKLKFKNKK